MVLLLLGVLALGHRTHWTFNPVPDSETAQLPPLAPASAAPSNSVDGPVQVARRLPESESASGEQDPQAIELAEHELAKAGVQLHRVGQRPIDQWLTAHGEVAYNQNLVAQLSSRVPGSVWRVEKQVGQRIHKGDVLAIVEAVEVGRAKADLLQAMVQAELKKRTLERLEAAGPSLPEKLVHEVEVEERLARIRVHNAAQTLINLGLPIRLDELRDLDDEQRIRQLHFLGLPAQLVEGLDPATMTANLLPLIAPFDGVVIGREISIGETVTPEQSHFVIADIRRMWVVMDVRKEDANLVRLGQPIDFATDGIPSRITGHVDWISTEVDADTRTLQVRAEVDNPFVDPAADQQAGQRMLRARTFGTARIVVRSNPLAVVVPNEALHWDGDSFFVFARDGQLFRRVTVRPGVVERGWTEVLTGLDTGTLIASEGSHVVKAELQLVMNER